MLTLRDKLSIKFWCNLDLIVIVLLGVMLSAYSIGVVTLSKQRDQAIARQVLSCPEDCVIVGTGDFSGGFWEGYTCIPMDDL